MFIEVNRCHHMVYVELLGWGDTVTLAILIWIKLLKEYSHRQFPSV